MKTNPNLKDNHYLNSNLKVQNNPISYEINTNIWEYKFQNNFGYAPSSLFSVHLDELIFIRLFCKSTVVPWKRWCFTELYTFHFRMNISWTEQGLNIISKFSWQISKYKYIHMRTNIIIYHAWRYLQIA